MKVHICAATFATNTRPNDLGIYGRSGGGTAAKEPSLRSVHRTSLRVQDLPVEAEEHKTERSGVCGDRGYRG